MKVKLMEPIEGYEDVAELRAPRKDDMFLYHNEDNSELAAYSTPQRCYVDYKPDIIRLILTKKQSLTESLGLEVGACYFRAHTYCLVEILDDERYRLHDFSDGGKTHGSPRLRSLTYPSKWRKVINADGSMVDGDLEWVTVGGFEVPKVDYREERAQCCCRPSMAAYEYCGHPNCPNT